MNGNSARYRIGIAILLLAAIPAAAQKNITLEDVWKNYAFYPASPEAFQAMPDGIHYTMVDASDRQNRSIVQYDFESGTAQDTILSQAMIEEHTGEDLRFASYTFNADQNKLLLSSEVEGIYRHSSRAYFHVYDLEQNTLRSVGEGKVRYATFSPDGTRVGYVQGNDLYYINLESGTVYQVTHDGEENAIINGATDWVYEEEFAFARAFFWSPSSRYLAFYRFDEREVPVFSMDVYGNGLYPHPDVFKYPKAGEKNAIVTAHLYDTESGTRANLLSAVEYEYIPRIKWNAGNQVVVYTTNRHQNELNLYVVDPVSGNEKLFFTETDDAYLEIGDDIHFLKDGGFVFTSERKGYTHIYHINNRGKVARQITRDKWDVTELYGVDKNEEYIYFQAASVHPSQREVYRVKMNGSELTCLSVQTGTNEAEFSPGMSYFTLAFSNVNTPTRTSLHKADGTELRVLEDNTVLATRMKNYRYVPREFFDFTTDEGVTLNGWMVKPHDFDKTRQYPVLMFVYGGPGSQTVLNNWDALNGMYYQYLASQGYIVVSVDNRGTGARGRGFKKITYQELGKYETQDQIASARYLAGLPYIDDARIGIWGWSYGGYMSSNCITQGAGVFKAAIAVAPVTNWRFYDSIYTERYMRTPQENAAGYDDNSPINHVDKLEGAYLLVHGSADDNVHVQNTMRMTEALVQANKQFELFIYPDKNHGIYGGNTRYHLYTLMTRFIRENI